MHGWKQSLIVFAYTVRWDMKVGSPHIEEAQNIASVEFQT